MKTKLLLLAVLFSMATQAQMYDLTLIKNSDYNYSVAAIPDFSTTSPNPYVSDQNFTVLLPDGISVANLTSSHNTATFGAIDSFAAGQDAIVFNLVQDIQLPAHTSGSAILVTTFDVVGSPTSGTIDLVANNHPLVMASTSFQSSYVGIISGNLADPRTENYNGQTGTTSFNFATLSTPRAELIGASLYPNPTTGMVFIKGVNDLQSVAVMNVNGQRVMSVNSNLESINVQALEAGVYFVNLETANAKTTLKLVKE